LQNGEVVDQSWKLTFTLSWRARAHSGEYRGKIECKDIEHDTFRDSCVAVPPLLLLPRSPSPAPSLSLSLSL